MMSADHEYNNIALAIQPKGLAFFRAMYLLLRLPYISII